MVRFQLTKKCTAVLLKKIWAVFVMILNWNPGHLVNFRLDYCKDLYLEFLYTNYEGQIIWMLLANAVYELFLVLIHLCSYTIEFNGNYLAFAAISLLFQVILITLKLCNKKFFKKICNAAFFLDLAILLLFELLVFEANSTELNLLFSLSFLINITASLQNSTFMMIFFIITLYALNAIGYTMYPPTGMKYKGQEILAGYLILTTATSVCLVVHYLINRQKRMSFERIENSVKTNLDIKREISKQDRLLQSIFPCEVAKSAQSKLCNDNGCNTEGIMENFRKLQLTRSENVSILFADIKGFTALSAGLNAKTLVQTLNELFARFDCLAESNRCMRIKILGDCYYCVAGLYDTNTDHAQSCVEMGLQMIEVIKNVSSETSYDIDMRVGIHTGSVFSGLIGLKKWQFDVWSSDVSVANKMEATGKPGRVHVSERTFKEIKSLYDFEAGCLVDGMKTYFITNRMKNRSTAMTATTESESHELANKDKAAKSKEGRRYRKVHPVSEEELLKGNLQERRMFGIAEVSRTLRILRRSENEDFSKHFPSNEFFAHLKKVVTSEHCKNLWKKFAHQYCLQFKRKKDEAEYIKTEFESLPWYCVSMTIMLLINFLTQLIMLPRNRPIFLLVNTAAVLIATALTVAVIIQLKKKTISTLNRFFQILKSNRAHRCALFLIMWLMTLIASTIGLIECEPNASFLMPYDTFNTQSARCDFAEYHLVIMSILVLFVVLPISDLPFRGTVMITTCSLFYIAIILPILFFDTFYLHYYTLYSDEGFNMFEKNKRYFGIIIASMIVFGMIVLWQYQCAKRVNLLQTLEIVEHQKKIQVFKASNCALLSNILPNHVIHHFLDPEINTMDLYYQCHERVGVMFAAIPDFSSYYAEGPENNYGLECLRLLNEIFGDFDQLLQEERFSSLEKIKTIGSTYMIASGLHDNNNGWDHLAALVQFSFALREKLHLLNMDSFTNFELRIGISHGPVVAGVIGASKPQYDIWGDTVNLASRMESTGILGKTQIVQETKNVLQGMGYQFEFRGSVNVKGKGELITYWII